MYHPSTSGLSIHSSKNFRGTWLRHFIEWPKLGEFDSWIRLLHEHNLGSSPSRENSGPRCFSWTCFYWCPSCQKLRALTPLDSSKRPKGSSSGVMFVHLNAKRKLNPPTSCFLTPKWLEDLEVTSWSVKKEDFYGVLPFNSTGPVLSPGWSRLSYLPVLTMGIKQPPWTGDRTACVLSCPPRRPQRSAHRYWREDDSTNKSPGDRKTNWGKRNTAFTRA